VGQLVAFTYRGGLRLGVVERCNVAPVGKPGPGRYRYQVRPCTVRDGVAHTWHRMFTLVPDRRHAALTPLDAAAADAMASAGQFKAWRAL